MFAAIRNRQDRKEGGFTLIELMVVVLIIAILIAIAIPTFLGARKRAQDKQAQSNLRNALTAEKTYFVDTQVYTTTPASLSAIESSLDFSTANGWVRGVVPEQLAAGNAAVYLRSTSRSGTTFCVLDLAQDFAAGVEGKTTAGTYYAKDTAGGAACVGLGAAAYSADVAAGW